MLQCTWAEVSCINGVPVDEAWPPTASHGFRNEFYAREYLFV